VLELPAIMDYQDPEDPSFVATIYQDDRFEETKTVYAIPSAPRVRRDSNGDPVFKLVVYKFSNDDLEEDEGMPEGGGYVMLDVDLSISAEHRERMLTAVAADRGVDAVTLGSPEFVDGEVRFLTVRDPNLVVAEAPPSPKDPVKTGEEIRGHLGVAKPSLMAGMVAGFTATLTPAGATFFQKTLIGEDGKPVQGLPPVRVEYDIRFWARLPEIHVRADAKFDKVRTEFASVWHDFEGRSCNEGISSTTEHYWDSVVASQSIDMEFDFGTLPADDPARVEIRQFVMGELTKWLQSNVLELTPNDDPVFADMDDIYKSHDDVYRLRTSHTGVSSDFHLDIRETSIGEKRLFPNGALDPLFGGETPDDIERFVQEISLDNEFFQKVVVEPLAYVDWAAVPIASVEVDIRYQGDDAESRTFTFAKDSTARRRVIFDRVNRDRRYEYRYRVHYRADGQDRSFESKWATTNARELDVTVAETGVVAVDINLGTMRWGQVVDAVTVEFEYSDPANDIDRVVGSKTYTKESNTPRDRWSEEIFAPATGTLTATATWTLKDGDQIVEELEVGDNREITLHAPRVPTVDAEVIVRNVDAVELVVLDMRTVEDDPEDVESVSFEIRPEAGQSTSLSSWAPMVPAGSARQWQYRYLIIPRGDDEPTQQGPGTNGAWSPPIEHGLTQVVTPDLPMGLVSQSVKISPRRVAFGDDLLAVSVVVTYASPDGSIIETFDETFESGSSATFDFQMRKGDLESFAVDWVATYHMAEGDKTIEGTSRTTFVGLPATPN
jgi:hypothetical protein